MSRYLIKLTPVGKFFFGGEMKFESKKDDKSQFVSYIIRSNKFPQQTSLLGMLRFLILRNNAEAFDARNQRIQDKAKAQELIGAQSFCGVKQSYGKIQNIGPCCLMKDGKPMVQLAKDHEFEVDFSSASRSNLNGLEVEIPKIVDHKGKEYSSKNGIKCLYSTDGNDAIDENNIFAEDVRIGIDRNIKNGQTEDNSLFKQICYRLGNEAQYAFAFEAEVNDIDLKRYNGQIVSVGGDSSQFVIEVLEPQTTGFKDQKIGPAIVLTSPAFIGKEALRLCRFAMTDTIPFRYMKTETENVHSYNRANLHYDSKKHELYATGSVFYFEDAERQNSFAKELEAQDGFYQIGYNHYIVRN